MDKAERAPPHRLAAQYLRMSTEHQRYSTAHQADAIAAYALKNGIQVIQTYADEGISGVSIRHRLGLQSLLADVVSGAAAYDTVLVYDVSRWGRFQNPDQGAHYEFLCAEAGVQVEYCAEQFSNDGSLSSTLLKSLKRVMAAEYSRELSAKVDGAQRKFLALGFWQGASAGYGLRRQMVRPDGTLGAILNFGEHKALQDRRVILVPGPASEVAVIRRIYRMFVRDHLSPHAIARALNQEQIPSERSRDWTWRMVTTILTNPKYVGELVGRRTTRPLSGGRRKKAPETRWVRAPSALPAIVSQKVFEEAQARFAQRRPRLDRPAMLSGALELYRLHGRITWLLIDEARHLPGAEGYRAQFGKIHELRVAMGLTPGPVRRVRRWTEPMALAGLARLLDRTGYLSTRLIQAAPDVPSTNWLALHFGSLRAAYMLVGFAPMSPTERRSPVGRARSLAAAARLERWLAMAPSTNLASPL